jgi:hypothetical protein
MNSQVTWGWHIWFIDVTSQSYYSYGATPHGAAVDPTGAIFSSLYYVSSGHLYTEALFVYTPYNNWVVSYTDITSKIPSGMGSVSTFGIKAGYEMAAGYGGGSSATWNSPTKITDILSYPNGITTSGALGGCYSTETSNLNSGSVSYPTTGVAKWTETY